MVVPFVVMICDTSTTRTKMAASGYHLKRFFMVPWLAIVSEQGVFHQTTSLTNLPIYIMLNSMFEGCIFRKISAKTTLPSNDDCRSMIQLIINDFESSANLT